MVRVGGADPLPFYPDDAQVKTSETPEAQASEAKQEVGENASGTDAATEKTDSRPTGSTLATGDSWEKMSFLLKIGQSPSGTSGSQQVSKFGSGEADAVRDSFKVADGAVNLADSSPGTRVWGSPGPPIGPKPTGAKGPKDHGIPDTGPPRATNLTEKAADTLMGKIHDKVAAGLKSTVDFNRHPQLSSEQEALVDFTTGVHQYKQYLDYAKTALELYKLYPNDSAIKQRLTQVMGKLDELGTHLGTVGAVLGKVEKYAGVVKDAIGIAKEAGDLVKNFKNMPLDKFADSFSKVNAHAQGLLGTARDTLIGLGLEGSAAAAAGGLVLGGLGAYLNLADDALQAGMKNVKAYIEHEQKAIREGETGVKEMPPEAPKLPPPPEVQTVGGARIHQTLDNLGQVHRAVHNEFEAERVPIKAKFDADKQKAHANFDQNEFPQIYKQHRGEIERALKEEFAAVSRYPGPQTPAEWKKYHDLQGQLQMMEEHGRNPGTAALKQELDAFGPAPPWAGKTPYETHANQGGTAPAPGQPNSSDTYWGSELTKKLKGLYDNGLSNRYERDHLDNAGLQKRYADAGLGSQQEWKVEQKLDRELNLVDEQGGIRL